MPSSVLDYPFLYEHVAATAQITIAPGTLHSITLNRGDVAAGATATIYDSDDAGVSGDVVGIVTLDNAVFVVPTTLTYDVQLVNGLYVEFSVGLTTADLTVSYR